MSRVRYRSAWVVLSVLWLVLTCCATPVVSWTVWETARASRAAAGPAEAVHRVIGGLGEWADPELARVTVYLADDELRSQLIETRRKLASHGAGYELALSNLREAQTANGVTVTVDVAIVSAVPDESRILFMQTQDEEWVFDTINDRGLLSPGWKVSAMRIPDICTVYYTSC